MCLSTRNYVISAVKVSAFFLVPVQPVLHSPVPDGELRESWDSPVERSLVGFHFCAKRDASNLSATQKFQFDRDRSYAARKKTRMLRRRLFYRTVNRFRYHRQIFSFNGFLWTESEPLFFSFSSYSFFFFYKNNSVVQRSEASSEQRSTIQVFVSIRRVIALFKPFGS